MSLTVASLQTLMPLFAESVAVDHHGAAIFGFLGAATGVGALGGAIFLASRRTVVGLGRAVGAAAVLSALAMIAFAVTLTLPLMLATAAIAGFGMIVTFAASNTLLQTIVEDHMRSRLMSFFVLAVMGASPLGSLIAGAVADRIGGPKTVIVGGIISIIGAALFIARLPAWRSLVRPIYVKRGILPEIEPDAAG
jgi:MFS family permease